MSSLSDDIIKYGKGELSPKEMHALEKKALSDPFLADALEGTENISVEDFSKDVQSINEKIRGGGRSIIFTPLRIAAGVLIVAVASFLIYQVIPQAEKLAQAKKEKQPTKADSQKVSTSQAKVNDSATTKPTEPKQEILKPDSKLNIAQAKDKAHKTAPSSGKPTLVEPNSVAQVNDQPSNLTIAKSLSVSEAASGNIQPSTEEEKVAEVDAVSVPSVNPSPQSTEPKRKEAMPMARSAKAIVADIQKKISGQVLAAEDGSPMPGVNVMLKGTTEGTVTDASGNFQLNLSQPNQPLVFSFVGYESQEINAAGKDKVNVALKEDAKQLSEIVVTGLSTANDSDKEPVIKGAEPVGGIKAYDKYLDDNLRYPQQALENKIKGKVVIEFTVRTDGSLDEFNVIKKLGYGCDEEGIRLVKEGPDWKPGTQDNVPVENSVRVKMKFNPDKKK